MSLFVCSRYGVRAVRLSMAALPQTAVPFSSMAPRLASHLRAWRRLSLARSRSRLEARFRSPKHVVGWCLAWRRRGTDPLTGSGCRIVACLAGIAILDRGAFAPPLRGCAGRDLLGAPAEPDFGPRLLADALVQERLALGLRLG